MSRSYLSWGPPAAVHAHAPVLQSFDRSLEYNTVGQLRHQFTDPMPEQFSRIFGYDGLGRVVRDTGAYMPYDECTYDPDDGWHCPDSTLVVDTVRSLVYDAVGNAAGWAEPHPIAEHLGVPGLVMLYTPRTMKELDVVVALIVDAYNFVTGRSLDAVTLARPT